MRFQLRDISLPAPPWIMSRGVILEELLASISVMNVSRQSTVVFTL